MAQSLNPQTSALVLLPPPQLWPPINRLRLGHDRRYRRWMPHITLLFPLVDRRRIDTLRPQLRRALSALQPFEVRLAEFDLFAHRGGSHTVYLVPEPQAALRRLHAVLAAELPQFDDSARFGGFTPHLTVGAAPDRERALALLAALRAIWQPVTWQATAVEVVWRNEAPDDVMRVGYREFFGAAGVE